MSNLRLKLASLLAAVLLALFVNYFFAANEEGSSVVQLIAPVEVRNVPSNKMIVGPASLQAELTLQGSSLFLSRIAVNPPAIFVNLPADVGQQYSARLRVQDVDLPPGVRVIGIKPEEINLSIDNQVTKSIPVVVPRIGTPPEDYRVDNLTIVPEKVVVRGPESELKDVHSIGQTFPLDLRNLTQSFSSDLDLRVPGKRAEGQTRRVTVNGNLSILQGELSFDQVPVEVRSTLSTPVSVDPAAVVVKLKAPRSVIKNFQRAAVLPFVKVGEKFDPGAQVAVQLEPIEGVLSMEIVPQQVVLIDGEELPEASKEASKESSKKRKIK